MIYASTFSKMLMPGLRVGYGVFPERAADAIMRHKEPWTVNSLAQEAGVAVLDDAEYARVSIKTIKKEKAFLEKGLERMEIGYLPSDANFYMLHVGDAEAARSALLKKGILVRDCSNFAGLDGGYIRVAVRTREENHLLLKELAVLKKARPAARTITRLTRNSLLRSSARRVLTTVIRSLARSSTV